jgi:hypothetical protein
VRENLERDPSLGRKHAVYDEMRAKGLTDYVAWPLYRRDLPWILAGALLVVAIIRHIADTPLFTASYRCR